MTIKKKFLGQYGNITYHPLKGIAGKVNPPQLKAMLLITGIAYHRKPSWSNSLYLQSKIIKDDL